MQLDVKKHHSTVLCGLMFDLINHYLSHGSNLYSRHLDERKTFDCIHFGGSIC